MKISSWKKNCMHGPIWTGFGLIFQLATVALRWTCNQLYHTCVHEQDNTAYCSEGRNLQITSDLLPLVYFRNHHLYDSPQQGSWSWLGPAWTPAASMLLFGRKWLCVPVVSRQQETMCVGLKVAGVMSGQRALFVNNRDTYLKTSPSRPPAWLFMASNHTNEPHVYRYHWLGLVNGSRNSCSPTILLVWVKELNNNIKVAN